MTCNLLLALVLGVLLLTACAGRTDTPISITQAAATPVPAATAALPTPTLPGIATATSTIQLVTATPPPTDTSVPPTLHGDGPCAYQATFLGDVTFPDNTFVSPGTAFVKTWRVRNE